MANGLVRQDIWALEQQQTWHPVTHAYALGVRVMQSRQPTDPTSWVYQAAVHSVQQGADQWRNQCQHNSWFFLPWHRMYLYWFERMVRAAIQTLDAVDAATKASWALPYWNYDGGGRTNTLPIAFRQTTMPDGTPNPLYVRQRDPAIRRGGGLPAQITSAALALAQGQFTAPSVAGATVGFGGPQTAWHHFGEDGTSTPGAVEATPHNVVHTGVGGRGGFMSDLDTAPLDPVFWLHHANIDRLWTVWLAQSGRSNPMLPAWLQPPVFHFHDEHGQDVTRVPADVLDPAALGYSYAQVPGGQPVAPHVEVPPMPPAPPPDHPAELVGATDAPVQLSGQDADLSVTMTAPSGPLRARAATTPPRVYLNVEDIRAERNPGLSYGVYVDAPAGADEATRQAYHVGNVSFFGVERAADFDRDHPGGHGGLRYVFDITDVAARLRAEGRWDDSRLDVSFSPLRPVEPDEPDVEEEPDAAGAAEERAAAETPVHIGRVSVFYQ